MENQLHMPCDASATCERPTAFAEMSVIVHTRLLARLTSIVGRDGDPLALVASRTRAPVTRRCADPRSCTELRAAARQPVRASQTANKMPLPSALLQDHDPGHGQGAGRKPRFHADRIARNDFEIDPCAKLFATVRIRIDRQGVKSLYVMRGI